MSTPGNTVAATSFPPPPVLCAKLLGKWFVCMLLLTLWGCAAPPPLQRVSEDDLPFFTDDLDRHTLISATHRQLEYLQSQQHGETYTIGSDIYSNSRLRESMILFLDILKTADTDAQLNALIRENFAVYQASGRKDKPEGEMLVTGYYEPLFAGSTVRRPPFLYPLYNVPDSLVTLQDNRSGEKKTGRYHANSQFAPYWTRQEIEQQNLLAGYELVYLQDPVDTFLLHVQGSGRISLPDGTIKTVHFAASNGHEYNSIGKLLVDEKKLTLEQVDIPAIRLYLKDHPNEQERILHHNPRYIFFSWGDDEGPRGSLGKTLTPGRSIAIDRQSLPVQAPAYLLSRRPTVDATGTINGWTSLRRFVLPQDSGAAIKGPGRVDLFWGYGQYAERAANHMKEEGRLFFLVKKGDRK